MFAWIKFLKDDIHTHFAMLISTVLLFHYNFFEPMPYFQGKLCDRDFQFI